MTVQELCKAVGGSILAGANGTEHPVTGGYTCDLLSWIIGRAREGDCLITVMGNINAVAVASLSDISCILLSEGAVLDHDAKTKADLLGLPVIGSDKTSFQLSLLIGNLLS
ncbi:MAG: hypothetical protein BGN88_13200 [Clostridiales bacterium 43-6]|nr:MAG: hypothetical protein BGN88_13200 [Clostridiales bacterium 43-6]